jgi:hypothetical protein
MATITLKIPIQASQTACAVGEKICAYLTRRRPGADAMCSLFYVVLGGGSTTLTTLNGVTSRLPVCIAAQHGQFTLPE